MSLSTDVTQAIGSLVWREVLICEHGAVRARAVSSLNVVSTEPGPVSEYGCNSAEVTLGETE